MINSKTDRFHFEQPEAEFVNQLKTELHQKKPEWFSNRASAEGVDISGAYLVENFPDSEKLLETAYSDFNRFLHVFEVSGNAYPIYAQYGETECFEAFEIEVTTSFCKVTAGDTEGIRRGLVFIEDELCKNEGSILAEGKICQKPHIRTRITRGSFSPTNRPPKNIDELENDIDYYPDEYLNRLAHDGANGIWIYTYFKKLLTFDDFSEYGEGSEKRIAKLQKIIAKCRRYGIRVYVFAIEPQFLDAEMTKKYPQAVGHTLDSGISSFCSYTEIGDKYCREMIKKLFTKLPGLGGFINISEGERLTVCSNFSVNLCPICGDKPRGEILAHSVNLFAKGKKETDTNGEFISWTYGHRYWKYEDIEEYVKKVSPEAVLMQNFEDAGYEMQLGKLHYAVDYWLSYVGPSQMFLHTAMCAKKYGKPMYAKLQVCSSHEIGSVPYIPVPGILFDKYKKCRELDVKGIMQCWYSGNYSCIMSKMAGDLSFTEDFSDKNAALLSLASKYYGKTNAPNIVKAWDLFEKAYKCYPINVLVSYYGPMHDSVAWHLSINPKDKELPRSWLTVDKLDGDRISDCIGYGHTLDEILILTEKMKNFWNEGLECLVGFEDDELASVAKAVGLLFESGHNIFRFYALREKLAHGDGDKLAALNEMEAIADAEIENSKKMIDICKKDNRLGYHGEAEGFKFFPAKIEARIQQLSELKSNGFPKVRERVRENLTPLPFYLGDAENGIKLTKGKITEAEFVKHPSLDAAFRISYDDKNIYVELSGENIKNYTLCFEFTPLWPSPTIEVSGGEIKFAQFVTDHQGLFGDRANKELAKYSLCKNVLTFSREDFGITQMKPMRLRIAADESPWVTKPDAAHTLGKDYITPEEFMWLMP